MLCAIPRQEFEAVAQSIAVTHQPTQLKRDSTRGKGQFQRGDFPWFQLSGKGYANAILSKLNGPSPKFQGSFRPEHSNRHSYVQRVTRIFPQFLWVSPVCEHPPRVLFSEDLDS